MATEGLDGWLQRVRKTEEYSDVVVRVNGVQDFRLHMLPLMNASAYFRNLPSSSTSDGAGRVRKPTGCKLVTIDNLPGGVEGFAISIDMCYLMNPELTPLNVSLACAAAEYLAMEDVVATTKKFMHTHIFSHWRTCINFLQTHTRLGSPIDEYVESRCKAVLETACVKSFTETKHLAAPFSCNTKQFSGALTELLVQVCSLPDVFVAEIVDRLVETDVNLSLKCRQGRCVRRWLESVMEDERTSDKAKGWIVLCLARMLVKNVPVERPWMELSSQYWCGLLEQTDLLLPLQDNPLKAKLTGVKATLEENIGKGLDEIDEYLRDYKFGPTTLLSLVETFTNSKQPTSQQSLREIATDVDQFLWFYAEERSISVSTFLRLFNAFPPSARASHDTINAAIQKLQANTPSSLAPTEQQQQQQQLQSVIDHSKLSMAMSSTELESILHCHSQELDEATDGMHLQKVMKRVIDASLMLLEENSQRSREIGALQKQFGKLLDCRDKRLELEYHESVSPVSLSSETEGSEISTITGFAYISKDR